jgi:hypothetical protein
MLCHDLGINTWYLPHNAVVMFTLSCTVAIWKSINSARVANHLLTVKVLFFQQRFTLCQAIKGLILLCINYYLNTNECSIYHLIDRNLFFKLEECPWDTCHRVFVTGNFLKNCMDFHSIKLRLTQTCTPSFQWGSLSWLCSPILAHQRLKFSRPQVANHYSKACVSTLYVLF